MAKDSMSNIAAVLCNFNDSRFLIDVIHKIAMQAPDEFIVVDDLSTDNSLELLKCLQKYYKFTIVSNHDTHGPFGSFVKGCREAKSKYVACFSADDFPMPDYLSKMRDAIEAFPFVDVYTCNTYVMREGNYYQRTLLPFTAYISPDYAVKIFKAGFAKDINQCGIVINRGWVLHCWENGGKDTEVNFDCMYSFLSIFEKGFVNLGHYLTTYRSYPTGWGAKGSPKKIKFACGIHKAFMKDQHMHHALRRALDSGIWSFAARWKAILALYFIMKLPKSYRLEFYKWFYSYDQRIEKL